MREREMASGQSRLTYDSSKHVITWSPANKEYMRFSWMWWKASAVISERRKKGQNPGDAVIGKRRTVTGDPPRAVSSTCAP